MPPARLIVLTDISSLTPGEAEPDDGQSMIRLMLYANEIDLEGLIATSNMGHGLATRPDLIRRVVQAYGAVRPNLLKHAAGYPSAEALLGRIFSGQPVAGPALPLVACIGPGKDTEASEWIIHVVDRPNDPRPVWVSIWGGSADLAQALWKVSETRPPSEAAGFVSRLRVHAVYDQDSTGAWIKGAFPGIYYITRCHGIRGMYRGGDMALTSPAWLEAHVTRNHGPLGTLYPIYDGGDWISPSHGKVRGVKEGDTPSYLGLLANGLDSPAPVEWGGWGGRCREVAPRRYEDAEDPVPGREQDPDPRMGAVYRWRAAYQADFQARMDWCVEPYEKANHPPALVVNGEPGRGALALRVTAGREIELDASGSTDPDGGSLQYQWSLYPEPTGSPAAAVLSPLEGPRIRCRISGAARPGSLIPVLLQGIDDGDPPLTRYRRILIEVGL